MDKKNSSKNPLIIFLIFAVVLYLIFNLFENDLFESDRQIAYSEFKTLVKSGEITKVKIGQSTIKADGRHTQYVTNIVPDPTLTQLLDDHNVSYSSYRETGYLSNILFTWIIPIFIFFAIWTFLSSRIQKNMGGGILGIGNKKLINSEKPETKFADVAGVEEAKEEVKEVVDFLRFPDRYISLGAKIPKGLLLVGPPGTGKTLLAKAVAGEANVPFFSVSGSSFIEMFVGVGASRVRDLFETAKKEAPAIVFIDEIDAIGKSRAAGANHGGNDEREQTLNQLLAEMDGFTGKEAPVIILAATNRPEILDAALLRPGRFDRQVLVDKPDFKGRCDILRVHSKGVKIASSVQIEDIARLTAGLAGADLANVINEAALLAGRKNQYEVTQADLTEAVERAIAGLEKKSRRISDKEKRIVTYHECGHALIAEITKGAKRVSKVSVIPRGLAALGYTLNTPEENRFLAQKHELLAEVDVLLGGRAAEHVFIKEISTGASNDLERATDIIKAMISRYGMSDIAGLMVLEKQSSQFLGGGQSIKDYSDSMAQKLDEYVKKLLDERFSAVVAALELYAPAIEKMVSSLYEKEVIQGSEVREIIAAFESENNLASRLQEQDASTSANNAQSAQNTESRIVEENADSRIKQTDAPKSNPQDDTTGENTPNQE